MAALSPSCAFAHKAIEVTFGCGGGLRDRSPARLGYPGIEEMPRGLVDDQHRTDGIGGDDPVMELLDDGVVQVSRAVEGRLELEVVVADNPA